MLYGAYLRIHLLLSLRATCFARPCAILPTSSTAFCIGRLATPKYNGKTLSFAMSIKGPSISHTGGRGKS